MTRRKIQYWVIPPEADSEFTACMEEVLETYALPYDAAHPVVYMDEQPVQLIQETRVPIPAIRAHPRRVDYEYERAGTACIFMFTEPAHGWRGVSVRPRRTKLDWALESSHALFGCGKGHSGFRQLEHPHKRGVIRGLRAGSGPCACETSGVSPYAKARKHLIEGFKFWRQIQKY